MKTKTAFANVSGVYRVRGKGEGGLLRNAAFRKKKKPIKRRENP